MTKYTISTSILALMIIAGCDEVVLDGQMADIDAMSFAEDPCAPGGCDTSEVGEYPANGHGWGGYVIVDGQLKIEKRLFPEAKDMAKDWALKKCAEHRDTDLAGLDCDRTLASCANAVETNRSASDCKLIEKDGKDVWCDRPIQINHGRNHPGQDAWIEACVEREMYYNLRRPDERQVAEAETRAKCAKWFDEGDWRQVPVVVTCHAEAQATLTVECRRPFEVCEDTGMLPMGG